MEVVVGGEEIADAAVGYAEAVLEFRGHGQDDGTKRIAGGADGVRGLFRMAALAKAATAGAVAGFDIELGDEGNDGWQVGLELHDQPWIEQRSVAVGAFGTGHINDAVDLVGGGCRANVGGMAVLAAGFFAAFFQLAAAKTRGW